MVSVAPMSVEEFGQTVGVSRETLARFEAYEDLLQRWQSRINLVSRDSLADVWRRHFLDSTQIAPWIDTSTPTLDMGSGAGFPGLVLAILKEAPVVLAESDLRKCAFLREARRVTAATAEIYEGRIEDLNEPNAFAVIVARALAPVSKLLDLAVPLLRSDGACVFLKGERAEEELRDARSAWRMEVEQFPSAADPRGVVLEIRNAERV